MATHAEDELLLPLFPLPNLVFFPNTRLPLHVFEPRYRRMISDALESDSRFGIVLLRPGWENDYHGNPPLFGCGTMGTIEQAISLEDGKYNILVRGDIRFRIVEEVTGTPYRTARVVLCTDEEGVPEEALAEREVLAELARQYLKYLPDQMAVPEIETVGLGALTNALIMSLNLELEEKQSLLESDDLIARARHVGNELTRRVDSLRFLAPYRHTGSDPSRN